MLERMSSPREPAAGELAGDAAARVLVARFLADRDETTFRALYRLATPRLWAFALRLCGGRAEAAEELVQECWSRAITRLDRFRGDSALASWLGGILLNCWREGRRELRWLEPGAEIDAGSFEEPVAGDPDARIDVEVALARLPDGSRAVLLLHDVEGLTHAEIGARLGIAAGTSKSRLFAARRALAQWFGIASGGSR
jgi:RNA polymerase sigma-70 factor (ECF subfamily)